MQLAIPLLLNGPEDVHTGNLLQLFFNDEDAEEANAAQEAKVKKHGKSASGKHKEEPGGDWQKSILHLAHSPCSPRDHP